MTGTGQHLPRIAVVGGGVIGCLTALACAASSCQVTLVEAQTMPNRDGLSYDYARLFRLVHDTNPQLQNLAQASLPFWRALQQRMGPGVVEVLPSLRLLTSEQLPALQQAYNQAGLGWRLERPEQIQANPYSLAPDLHAFWGEDAMVLNAALILQDLYRQLQALENVQLLQAQVLRVEAGHTLRTSSATLSFDAIILATAAPLPGVSLLQEALKPVRKYQYFTHLKPLRAGQAYWPVLTFGDENRCWSVPSIDRQAIKVSASAFAFDQPLPPSEFAKLNRILAANFNHEHEVFDSRVLPYYEFDAASRVQLGYWRRGESDRILALDACDAGLFKAAPALAQDAARTVTEMIAGAK